MLEIIALILVCKHIGETAERKGMSTGCLFQLLAVVFWFGGEIVGCIIGIIIVGEPSLIMYPFALLGAGAGALFAIVLVNLVPYSYSGADEEDDRPLPRRRRRRAPAKPKEEEPTTDFQDKRMLKRAQKHEQYEEWKEALEIYKELVRRSANEDVVDEAADRIKEVKREMGE